MRNSSGWNNEDIWFPTIMIAIFGIPTVIGAIALFIFATKVFFAVVFSAILIAIVVATIYLIVDRIIGEDW